MTSQTTRIWHAAFIVLFVICLRLPYLGNPAINIDEQYYLVFADKWLNGGLVPYVDIWDRKPIGIFLLYGPAVRWFTDGVVGYQLTAGLFVLLTCAVVYRIGRLIGDPPLALAAALIYATCPSLMDGAGGQTPVFYNLPIAVGALLILQVLGHKDGTPLNRRTVVWHLLGASLLFGAALQIKYVCVLEIATLCLIALFFLWRAKILHLKGLLGLAAGMIVCGLAATLIAALAFYVTGHWHAFFYANFESIFAKKIWRLSPWTYLWRLVTASAFGAAFLPLAAYALTDIGRKWRLLPSRQVQVTVGLAGWIVAAFIGGLLLGNPTSHYFLPSAVPLSVLAALEIQHLSIRNPFSAARPQLNMFAKTAATLALPIIACYFIMTSREDSRGKPADVYAIAQTIKDRMHGGCLYVFDHFPVLYYLTHSCVPTMYAFPNHLNELSEMHSLEVDSLTELRRTLSSHPAMIFVRRPFSAALDPAATADLEAMLVADYKLDTHFDAGWQSYDLYVPASTAR